MCGCPYNMRLTITLTQIYRYKRSPNVDWHPITTCSSHSGHLSLLQTPDVTHMQLWVQTFCLSVVTIKRSWRTIVVCWRIWRWRALTCHMLLGNDKKVDWCRLIVEGFKLNCLVTSCWWHRAASIPIALLRSFSKIRGRFPIWISCNRSVVFVCTRVGNETPVDVCFPFACRDQLFCENCKMLLHDVMWHILWWSLIFCFLCVLEGRKIEL
jgi:hypothetical protein